MKPPSVVVIAATSTEDKTSGANSHSETVPKEHGFSYPPTPYQNSKTHENLRRATANLSAKASFGEWTCREALWRVSSTKTPKNGRNGKFTDKGIRARKRVAGCRKRTEDGTNIENSYRPWSKSKWRSRRLKKEKWNRLNLNRQLNVRIGNPSPGYRALFRTTQSLLRW